MNIKTGFTLLFLLIAFFVFGCSKDKSSDELKPEIIAEKSDSVTYRDDEGSIVTVKKNPERPVFLFNSLLDLWYYTGGTAVGRVDGDISIPDKARCIQTVGAVGTPNLEKIFSLNPDFIVLYKGMKNHRKMLDFFKKAGIPYIILRYQHYDDFLFISDLFFRLNSNRDGTLKINSIRKKVQSIIDKCPEKGNPLVMITFATASNITCELPAGDTGRILSMVKGRNVINESPVRGSTRVEFSIEQITRLNPGIMLVKTMGEFDKVKERLTDFIRSNRAFAGIDAVKNSRIYFLPKELFMYKPNASYPEAFYYLASILYPSVFSEKCVK
ncbi:MAG: ABC transporter substrate-binding protein [Spirochaetes bacterium]|nr:ABC transporter substrate-binding protein [Spirochaetota bacterium]